MEKKLQLKDYLYLGSMLFGLFFGAGNLIFPIHMGQLAGKEIFSANLGFLITGIGLPFLGVLAIGISKQSGILEVAKRVHPMYGIIFTILLYLVIGPFFALPRLASTSFEIAFSSVVTSKNEPLFLLFFSLLFFLFVFIFALKPAKLLDYVGKYLNPLFLILLFVIIAFSFFYPMGNVSKAPVSPLYQHQSFVTGLKEGYNTLDALASLAFGIIIVSTLKQMGVKKTSTIAKDTLKSGLISIFIMGVIYTSLSFMGTFSLEQFTLSENGGIALSQIASYYLGVPGQILLAFIVIIACFKTAIGLSTAFAETFTTIMPSISYKKWLILATILPALVANFGLTNIIQGAVPVLMFIYPLAITLIFLVLTSALFSHKQIVYQTVTGFTLIGSFIEGLQALPVSLKQASWISFLLKKASILPFFDLGMSWLLFSFIGLLLGLLLKKTFSKRLEFKTKKHV